MVESKAFRTGGSRVSNTIRLAAAQAVRLARTRQPAAIRSRTGCSPSRGSPKLPLRQRRLDCRDGETTENRIDTTFSRKAEEGRINAARGDMSLLTIAYYPNSVAGTFSFLQMKEDVLAERGMVALIDTAKRTLTSSSRDSLRWHVGLDEKVQRDYLAAIADLLDLLEKEHGREKVGIVSISEDKNWVVARWMFLRLLEDATRLYGNSPNLAYVLDMAISQRGLYFHGWREDLAKEARAAILQTVQATLEPSPRDLLQWHVGIDESSQRIYLSAVAKLLDLLEREEQSRSEPGSDVGPAVTAEERSALIDLITDIRSEGRENEAYKGDTDELENRTPPHPDG